MSREIVNAVETAHWDTGDYDTVEEAEEANGNLETAMSILRGYQRGIRERIELLREQEEAAEERNMYGCLPCPYCGSEYRYAVADAPNTAICDTCGKNEENADIRTD